MDHRMLARWKLKWCSFFASVAVLSLTTVQNVESVHHEDPVKTATSNGRTCSKPQADQHRLVMLVSTLDGKVTALNMEDGNTAWSLETGSRPLLSSSISKLEINRNGVSTKLIPSLDGGLYQFDGDGLEPVPLAADMMLSSSFRFNDNTMVVGGKEKETFGLDLSTGKMLYTCSASGCEYFNKDGKKEKLQKGEQENDNTSAEEVIVITRHTKTIRAVEMKTGGEKWNFSVGTHDISYIRSSGPPEDIRHIGQKTKTADEPDIQDGCTVEDVDEQYDFSWLYEKVGTYDIDDIDFKVIVPKGLVIAFNKLEPNKVLWKHKFDTAIANAWILSDNNLSEVSLFDDRYIPALSSEGNEEEDENIPIDISQPMIYIGVHEKQLYVQPSVQMSQTVRDATAEALQTGRLISATMPYITWKPYLATAASRTPIMVNHRPLPQLTWEPEQDTNTELSTWHQNYPYDEGYYLFNGKQIKLPIEESNETSYMEEIFTQDITITLWNWWREVLAITMLTAAITHYLTVHCVPQVRNRYFGPGRSVTEGISTSESGTKSFADADGGFGDNVDEAKEAVVEYVSRYYTDFTQEACLGKGGFGVVFQSKNKLDDCEYAIKRITLNDSERAREKVMREVKALAKLEHPGIVRYHQAWFENPPIGWQEERDKSLLDTSATTSPGFSITEYTPTNYSPNKSGRGSSLAGRFRGAGDFNPLKPFPILEESGASGMTTSSNHENVKRVGSTEGFVPHSDSSIDFDEESESSSGITTPASKLRWCKDESFDIVFQNSDNEDETSETSEKVMPFNKYVDRLSKFSDNTTESLDIVFEDSGCEEKSKSCETWGQSEAPCAIIDCIAAPLESNIADRDQILSDTCSKSVNKSPEPAAGGLIQPIRPNSLNWQKGAEGGGDNERGSAPKQPKLYLYIQMQLCRRESLKEWLCNNIHNRDRDFLLDLFVQTLSAVEYVHEMGLMHRDLKPSNIFFSMDGQVKIGDFGLVTALEENCEYTPVCDSPAGYFRHTDQVGTRLYMSPEQGEGRLYTHKVDIYALGVVFVELFCPFSTQMERVRTLVEVRRLLFPAKLSKEYETEVAFVKPLLSPNPDERPSASDILQRPLLSNVQANTSYNSFGIRNRTRTRTISSSSSCGSSHT